MGLSTLPVEWDLPHAEGMTRIVVGVDGSESSHRALEWAVDEARLRHATVEAVHAWTYSPLGTSPYHPSVLDPSMMERIAHEVLDEAIAAVDTSGVTVSKSLVCDGAATALLEEGKGADLLVVGSRGRGGFAGLLLGSVSQQIVHHARCPVVIIPAELS